MTMKTPEDLFHESILYYQKLIRNATDLSDRISDLSPEEILEKCKQLQGQRKKQMANDAFIIEIMSDTGSEILNESFVGEYQRTLDKAIHAYDKVTSKAKTIKTLLNEDIQKLKKGQNGLAGYRNTSSV